MAKVRARKSVPTATQSTTTADLRQALAKQKKADLIDALLELAEGNGGVLRQLTARFEVEASQGDLEAATRRAIADATRCGGRGMNIDFDYDDAAYREVKHNFGRMILAGQLPLAMRLALELMKLGSLQVEMSDQGLMYHEIENCLKLVIAAVRSSNLPAAEGVEWCKAMLATDRVECIADEQLMALLKHFQGLAARKPQKG